MKKLFWTFAAFALLFACDPQETPVNDPTTPGTEEPGKTDTPGGNDNPTTLKVECVTGEATDVDPTSAKLSGTVTITNAKDANGSACFYYSANQTEAAALAKDGTKADAGAVAAEGGSFTVTISGLDPDTEYHFMAAVTIDGEQSFGAVKAFTTAEKPKELTVTGSATDVTEWSAVLAAYANPTTDMGTVTMGILYSTEENPTLDNGVKLTSSELDNNNMYTVKAKDLASNTTYYYKSTFEYNGVLRSGDVKSFKTKDINAKTTTLAATEVGLYQATLNGKLEVNSSEKLNKEVWFYLSTEEDTVEGLMDRGKKLWSILNDDGSFAHQLSGFTGQIIDNTTYYYVAVSKVHDTLFLGEVQTFVTTDMDEVVSIETGDVDEITLFTATFHGKLTIDSGESLNKSVWCLFSDTENTLEGLLSNGKYCDAVKLQDDGTFYCQKTNLKHSTNYYYVACCEVDSYPGVEFKRYYGEVKSFSTTNLDDLVTISTEDPSDVGCKKATLNGKLVVDSQENLNKNIWFLMSDSESTLEGLKTAGNKDSWISLQEDGTFYKNRSDLKHSSTYYYVACAKVYDKEYYGEVKAINTTNLDDIVTLLTEDPSDVSCKKATLNGKLSVESEEYLSKSVWFLMSESENTLEGLKSAGNTYQGYTSSSSQTDGTFHYYNASLNHSSTYYYVACAKVDDKEFYGEVKSFNTTNLDQLVTLYTEDPSDVGCKKATLNGKLSVDSEENLNKSVWFLMSDSANTLDGLKSIGKSYNISIQNDGTFYSSFSDLNHSTTYYFVACAKVDDKEYYGEIKSLSTTNIDDVVTISTDSPSNVGYKIVTMYGKLSVDSEEDLYKSVWFLISDSESTLEGLKTSGINYTVSLQEDGSFYKKRSDLKHGSRYYYVACAKVEDKEYYGDVQSFATDVIPDGFVDLGLSVFWATCNIGASAPEEQGNYYAWGETLTKSSYFWTSYKWSSNASNYKYIKKYGENDTKRKLEDADDVANKTLGGKCRIPTPNEFDELISNCNIEKTTLNEVTGWKFTSKKTDYTDMWIFLPATGYIYMSTLYESNSYGLYWSSSPTSIYSDSPYTWTGARILQCVDNKAEVNSIERCKGLPVRPVLKD